MLPCIHSFRNVTPLHRFLPRQTSHRIRLHPFLSYIHFIRLSHGKRFVASVCARFSLASVSSVFATTHISSHPFASIYPLHPLHLLHPTTKVSLQPFASVSTMHPIHSFSPRRKSFCRGDSSVSPLHSLASVASVFPTTNVSLHPFASVSPLHPLHPSYRCGSTQKFLTVLRDAVVNDRQSNPESFRSTFPQP